jgi:hypothetical protein
MKNVRAKAFFPVFPLLLSIFFANFAAQNSNSKSINRKVLWHF